MRSQLPGPTMLRHSKWEYLIRRAFALAVALPVIVTLAACDAAGNSLKPDSTGVDTTGVDTTHTDTTVVDSLAYVDTIPYAAPDYVVAEDLTLALHAPVLSYILNDNNHVAGAVGPDTSVAGDIAHAFLWTPTGVTSLHDDGCLGVRDFTNNDQVVCVDTTLAAKVGVWQNGHISAIPALESQAPYSSMDVRMNDSGAIAGVLTSPVCPTSCAFRLVGDSIVPLYQPATYFRPQHVNARGDFLTQGPRGNLYDGTDFWFQAGVDTAIGRSVGVMGGLVDMNDSGTVVGTGYTHGVAINDGIIVIVNGHGVSMGHGTALGVNNSGVVVGKLEFLVNSHLHSAPYRWTGKFELMGHAIATPGWTLLEPVAINNAGSMLVIANDSSASRFGDLVLLTHN